MSVLPIPITRLRPEWIEHVAIRLFAKVGRASRPKVRTEIVAYHRGRGVSKAAAEADADRALAYIDARIALYAAAAAAPLDIPPGFPRQGRSEGRG